MRTKVAIIVMAALVVSLAGCQEIVRHRAATSGIRHAGGWQVYDRWPFNSKAAADRQDETARNIGMDKNISLDIGDGKSIAMVLIPAGQFVLGSQDEEPRREHREGPRQDVTISHPFYMSVHEITQDQYKLIAAANPSHFVGGDLPVECVSWEDADAFCQKLSAKCGKSITLPTEAQWEYACRAGTETPFHFGKTIATHQANYDGNYAYGKSGRVGQFRKTTVAGGGFPPNAFGLCDMHGNVWEWCSDWFEDSYLRIKNTDPKGAPKGTERVLRGGCWYLDPGFARSAYRFSKPPDYADERIGFRIVMEISATQAATKPAGLDQTSGTFDSHGAQEQTPTSGPVFDRSTPDREIRGAVMEVRQKYPDGGIAMWRQLAALVRPGMTMWQAKMILPPELNVKAGAIKRGEGKYFESWPVDAKTIVEFRSSDGDELDRMIVESAATVRPIAPEDFKTQVDSPTPPVETKPSPTSAPDNWGISPGDARPTIKPAAASPASQPSAAPVPTSGPSSGWGL